MTPLEKLIAEAEDLGCPWSICGEPDGDKKVQLWEHAYDNAHDVEVPGEIITAFKKALALVKVMHKKGEK